SGGSAPLTVNIVDGSSPLGTAPVAADGSWNFSGTLGEGTHALVAVVSDQSGQIAQSAPARQVKVDTQAPQSPIIALAAASDTGIKGDDTTSLASVSIEVTGAAGDLVTLGSAMKTLDSSGHATFAGVALAAGSNAFAVIESDAAGNASAAAGLTVT